MILSTVRKYALSLPEYLKIRLILDYNIETNHIKIFAAKSNLYKTVIPTERKMGIEPLVMFE